MNGLLTHSNLSLDSFRAPSIISLSTDSSRNSYISDDRVHGIGAISGRAVMAVGQVALRGMEHLAIRRKLRTIKSFFPHYDDLETKDAGLVYDDVLELSRYVFSHLDFHCQSQLIRFENLDRAYIAHKFASRPCRYFSIKS